MRLRRSLLALLLATALPLPASLPLPAQTVAAAPTRAPAHLTADQLAISGDSLLVATGHVEVRYGGEVLRASAIIYDRSTDQLQITGPITLIRADGTQLSADYAELSGDFTQGLLRSARVVMNQQLQIAAAQVFRAGGRYTQISNAVASSCQVCAADPVPLWEIRARRIVHDAQDRQLYFDSAQLRVAGVPVFFIPRLRMPDPTQDRSTGFLSPEITRSTNLGTGMRLPYFIALGDSRDVTLYPFASSENGRALGLRYREAFAAGEIAFTGTLARDDIMAGEQRGYLQGEGRFALDRGFALSFELQAVSDRGYLQDYDISDNDRLVSQVEITRTRRNEYISSRLLHFHSIREIDGVAESNASLPTVMGDFTLHRRFNGGPLGGEAGLRFRHHAHYRSSNSTVDSDGDSDTIADGRDLARSTLDLDWRRTFAFGPGFQAAALAEMRADVYSVQQDAVYSGVHSRLGGAAAVELRWPWVGSTADGAAHVIEPVLQLVTAPADDDGDGIPNEDSTISEFDEGNLFALSRYSGNDAYEAGTRLNAGLMWTRYAPSGWALSAGLGRIWRTQDQGQFSDASGLDGAASDWLVAAQVVVPGGMTLTNRMLFADLGTLTKAELRMELDRDRYGLSSTYVWLQADEAEADAVDTETLLLDARYALTDAWSAQIATRYDFEADRASRAGLGLIYRNECLLVDLSLSRRYSSSTSVTATTSFGLSVDLLGFGARGKPGPAGTCRG